MATRDKLDQETLAVWTRIALALERIAANTMQSADPQSAGLPQSYYMRTDPLTIDPPKASGPESTDQAKPTTEDIISNK